MDGDPSLDVVQAAVIFLVDAKLVLLQPNRGNEGTVKYEMRIIANDVEYFDFTRGHVPLRERLAPPASDDEGKGTQITNVAASLDDSLWYFDGQRICCWIDFQDLLRYDGAPEVRPVPKVVSISTDFYPTSIMLSKGLITGLDADLVQRQDVTFASCRYSIRVSYGIHI